MILTNLTKTTTKSKKRVGRGYGSGVGGHTTGRGSKGQKIRSKVKLTNDGTKIKKSWLKRLPFLKGKGRLSVHQLKPINLPISKLSLFPDKSVINYASISTVLKISQTKIRRQGIKVIGDSFENLKALTIDKRILLSRRVKQKVISAGGKII